VSITVAPGRLMSRVPPLLRETAFRRYWSAQSISLAGDQISSIALPLAAVLALHANPAEMGYLSALIWLPSLLFALHAGAWVDRRGHRRATMIAADLGRAALLASIPVCSAWYSVRARSAPSSGRWSPGGSRRGWGSAGPT